MQTNLWRERGRIVAEFWGRNRDNLFGSYNVNTQLQPCSVFKPNFQDFYLTGLVKMRVGDGGKFRPTPLHFDPQFDGLVRMVHDGDGQISRKSEGWYRRGRDAGLAKTAAVHHRHFCFIKGKKSPFCISLSDAVLLTSFCMPTSGVQILTIFN